MARIRSVKPAFFGSLDIAALPISTRLTYIGLWCYADDKGRGIDDPRLVKAEVWPLDGGYSLRKVERDMQLLAEGGQLERYEVNGRRYFRVRSWHRHQHPNRPQASRLPRSPEEVAAGDKPPPDPDPFSEQDVSVHGAHTNGSRPEGRGGEMEGSGEETLSTRDATYVEPPEPVDNSSKVLVDRLLATVQAPSSPKVRAEARAVIAVCRQHVDDRITDQAIGYMAKAASGDGAVVPRYLLSVVRERAAEHGIVVPELDLGPVRA